ncbi:MAG: lipid-A-disaccharide synthase [Proteobacteria bacterium]|nr:lipid-A-disaccharide synthase [Pseudomonadota bacterium]
MTHTDPPPKIMVLTGEPSGDFHAGSLIKAMRRIRPDLRISGIGGPCMEAQQVDIFFPIEKLSAMGISEVIFQFRHIKHAFDTFKSRLKRHRPDLIILIDYPGFNLKAAQYAKQKFNIPILYYITPKVWAWKKSRLKLIKQYVDHAALIFPFEEKLYKKADIPSTYVGNPLMDDYPDPFAKPFFKGSVLDSTPGSGQEIIKGPVIGLLPGSRKAEITNLLPTLLKTAVKIHDHIKNARFLISAASDLHLEQIHQILSPYRQTGLFEIIQGRPIKIFRQSDLLIAASGTVTLEAALCCVPAIIVYKMSPRSYKIARLLVKVDYAGLANLIAGRELMPELLQEKATPEHISQKAFSMLNNLANHENQLLIVRKLLGRSGASKRAAGIAIDLINKSLHNKKFDKHPKKLLE